MCHVRLGMELSAAPVVPLVAAAVQAVSGTHVKRVPAVAPLFVEITIDTDDPDMVDVVRELCWQVDPAAAQHGLSVARCAS